MQILLPTPSDKKDSTAPIPNPFYPQNKSTTTPKTPYQCANRKSNLFNPSSVLCNR